jgi:hypothetical protein
MIGSAEIERKAAGGTCTERSRGAQEAHTQKQARDEERTPLQVLTWRSAPWSARYLTRGSEPRATARRRGVRPSRSLLIVCLECRHE